MRSYTMPSCWIDFVKQVQARDLCSYKEAMIKASQEWEGQQGSGQLARLFGVDQPKKISFSKNTSPQLLDTYRKFKEKKLADDELKNKQVTEPTNGKGWLTDLDNKWQKFSANQTRRKEKAKQASLAQATPAGGYL